MGIRGIGFEPPTRWRCWRLAGSVALVGVLGLAAPALARPAAVEPGREMLSHQEHQDLLLALESEQNEDLKILADLYIARNMAPIWIGENGPGERARAIAHALRMADYDGLDPKDYKIGLIDRLMEESSAKDLAELDVHLSLGLMQFVADLGSGRTEPSRIDPELFVYPRDVDKRQVLEQAAAAKDVGVFIGGFRPRQVGYWRLKGALASFRAIARAGGWQRVESGPTLTLGMAGPRVAQLRERLRRGRDLPLGEDIAMDGGDPARFDEALARAVTRFQERHGLEVDGRVGPKTLAALNVPVEARIDQIVLNLERRRWMPDQDQARHIDVNLAEFHLRLMEGGRTTFETPVVIGDLYNKTPVFTADMTYLVINPFWNVPPSIATGEILPKTQADPRYLQRHGFEVFSDWSEEAEMLDPLRIDWKGLGENNFRYKLRQRPGPTNALGRLKFVLLNEFNIYLHDTPERAHFDRTERSFSHGCIRVAEPEALAAAILEQQPDWAEERIVREVATGEREVVSLKEKLPVRISYLTAWVDDLNRIHFRNDVYGRDQILADALLREDGPPRTMAASDLDLGD
jgi:murein L,D-transpeptidase YcbB/YkuD